MTGASKQLRVVVDRKEGRMLVLTFDDGRSVDVPVHALPPDCRVEGAVLDVPQNQGGEPAWSEAKRNRQEEQSRRNSAAKILEDLRKRDPGGDIQL